MSLIEFPDNAIGLRRHGAWSTDDRGDPLDTQLKKAGIAFEEGTIPHLVGWGGCARLLAYTSPNTGLPVTVLAVPWRDVDGGGEDYYYFPGLALEAAIALGEPEWIRRYDAGRAMRDEWLRRAMEKKGRWTPTHPAPGDS